MIPWSELELPVFLSRLGWLRADSEALAELAERITVCRVKRLPEILRELRIAAEAGEDVADPDWVRDLRDRLLRAAEEAEEAIVKDILADGRDVLAPPLHPDDVPLPAPKRYRDSYVECMPCGVCGGCTCGDLTYGYGVCWGCTLEIDYSSLPEGVYPWLGNKTVVSERLDTFWSYAQEYATAYGTKWAVPKVDWDARFADLERLGC